MQQKTRCSEGMAKKMSRVASMLPSATLMAASCLSLFFRTWVLATE